MGFDELHLHVLAPSSEDAEKRNTKKGVCAPSPSPRPARAVLQLMENGRHWVLVMLLLGNIINKSLPIFLDSAISGGSTTAIVIFGSVLPSPLYTPTTANINAITLSHSEIIPQALSVQNGLAISTACMPVILALMYLFVPLAWPIVKLLNWAQCGRPRTHV
ncbi:hypothetical protein B0H10DRAFT_2443351 [Mycena sp. CBHHK59/15]|nr:hypothetical protein B0H10DRAFT_2443351 [Mycena sp. CBHHK59/15]